MTKRVLVTGGAGFIGSHTADYFLTEGWEVCVVDDLSSGKRENIPEKARFHHVSINSPEFAKLVREGRFDVVAHLAAQMDVRKSVDDPLFDATSNVLGVLNLMEAIRASGAKTLVVFASTGGALYGDSGRPPNHESTAKDPESPYAVSKLSAEYYLAYYGRVHGTEAVALRFGNVYGPRQDPHGEAGVVAIFCGRILGGEKLTIFGDGLQTRDYVYVGDVARAMFMAATKPLPVKGSVDARAFNIGTGRGTSVVELARLLQSAAGSNVPVGFGPARTGEVQDSFLACAKAHELLGWKPDVTLLEGLKKTYAWFAQNIRGAAA
ncbi:MAG TPA: NAD-dependent epimerase/dehydratase family protein [Gemmatimonadaceae bacterium]|nr:NAD-dependent epimerase/dehydratase family protein [Gemmatimonadaceae bacterium]